MLKKLTIIALSLIAAGAYAAEPVEKNFFKKAEEKITSGLKKTKSFLASGNGFLNTGERGLVALGTITAAVSGVIKAGNKFSSKPYCGLTSQPMVDPNTGSPLTTQRSIRGLVWTTGIAWSTAAASFLMRTQLFNTVHRG